MLCVGLCSPFLKHLALNVKPLVGIRYSFKEINLVFENAFNYKNWHEYVLFRKKYKSFLYINVVMLSRMIPKSVQLTHDNKKFV